MYFFDNHEDGLRMQNLNSLGDMSISVMSKKPNLFEFLTGEEKPRSIGSLLLILVLHLHL